MRRLGDHPHANKEKNVNRTDGCYGCAHSADEHKGPGFSCLHADTSTVTTGDLNTDDGITITSTSRVCECLRFQP